MTKFFEIFFIAMILWIFVYKISKLLYNQHSRKLDINLFLLIIVCAFLTTVFNLMNSRITEGILKVVFSYTLFCLFHKIVFNKSWQKVLVGSLILYICILICEVVVAVLASIILSLSDASMIILKNNILINLMIMTLAYLITNLLRNQLSLFIININNNKMTNHIIMFLVLLTISLLLYRIPINEWRLSRDFVATMVILLGLLITGLYLLKQDSDIEKTSSMYQQVIKYSNTTKKLLEDYRMVSHEHKNQLSIIRQMLESNKKEELIEYIDSLLNKRNNIKYTWAAALSYVPLAELQGLINYKLLEMEERNINVVVTISKDINKLSLKKISNTQKDHLYSIVGVYLDNAIEAASNSKKKEVSLEIYKDKKDIIMVLGNTFNEKIDINKVDDYGYSTKGKGRGTGLHIVRSILDEDKLFSQIREILNDYYIQKLIIHTVEIKK